MKLRGQLLGVSSLLPCGSKVGRLGKLCHQPHSDVLSVNIIKGNRDVKHKNLR